MVVVGDDPDAFVLDLRMQAPVQRLRGHLDYSFAAAWQPEQPQIVATGNQASSSACLRIFSLIITVMQPLSSGMACKQSTRQAAWHVC